LQHLQPGLAREIVVSVIAKSGGKNQKKGALFPDSLGDINKIVYTKAINSKEFKDWLAGRGTVWREANGDIKPPSFAPGAVAAQHPFPGVLPGVAG